MNNFRLLALRPLKGCNPKYLKKLKSDFLFKFSHNFQITTDNLLDHKTRKFKFQSRVPSILYDLIFEYEEQTKQIPVNISAIVGKNGSGKSSLVELLFLSIYNFSVEKGILKSEAERNEEDDPQPLQFEPNIKVEIFYQSEGNIYCLHIDGNENTDRGRMISTLYEYSPQGEDIWGYAGKVDTNLDHFQHFFYTIAINYSIYSLNSDHVGDWIEPLFHKNDSYQAPVVINPMRTKGNIDMKTENDLVNQRLLSNILQPVVNENSGVTSLNGSLRNLAPGKNAEFLQLVFDPTKAEKYAAFAAITNGQNFSYFNKFYTKYTGSQIFMAEEGSEIWSLMNYIIYKLKKICIKYPLYEKYLVNGQLIDTDKLIAGLLKDKSHITFKLKQAANLIRYYDAIQDTKEANGWINIEKYSSFIQEAISEVKNIKMDLQVIELIPPAIYDIKILFDKDGHCFDDFSSGEKQKVHSINSILYHLINLNSVFENGNGDSNDFNSFTRYKHVNIVFDEIELYFHPDLQRLFVYDLLQSIRRMNPRHVWNFQGIQLVFVTHSPFILSDIPSESVLYLMAEKMSGDITAVESKGETFGANIHDLLAHDFFMDKGFMGELAKTKIQSAIDHLQKRIQNLSDASVNNEWNEQTIMSLIDIIGEPMIKKSLSNLNYAAYGNNVIEAEIERLKLILEKRKGGNKI